MNPDRAKSTATRESGSLAQHVTEHSPSQPLPPLRSVGLPSLPKDVLQFFKGTGSWLASGEKPRIVPTLSVIHYGSSGDLVVACDSNLDPVLDRWLDKHCTKACLISDELQRLKYLVDAIYKTFRFSPLFNPFKAARFKELQTRERDHGVLLGDYIENGTGVCRHGATLLQLACQMVRINSFLSVGDRIEIDPKTLNPVGSNLRHVWQFATAGQNTYLADTSLNQVMKVDSWLEPLNRSELIRLYGADKGRSRTWTKESFGMSSCYRYTNDDSAMSFIRDLHSPQAAEALRAAFKIS